MRASKDLRTHVSRHHPEITEVQLERYFVECRHPDTDIDALVQRYVDRLETMIGLQYKGFFIKKYLQVLGVARHHQADKSIMRFLKNPDIKTPEDLRAEMERQLIGKFREASPEKRFQGYLNRDKAILENKGQAELIPAIETLKTIKFVKKQLQAAQEAKAESEAKADDTE
jgi:hypothetical protein